jgi:DNA end-binding protein Ku
VPRSLWNGTLTLGLITVPVKLYSATQSKAISFKQAHATDGSPVQHRRFCAQEGREIPYAEIAKGFEVAPGEYVLFGKDEVKAAAGARTHVVDVEELVPAADIDPAHYDKTYWLGPGKGGDDAYRLVARALEKTGRVGIGRFTFHDRERIAGIRAADGLLRLHTLRIAEEVRDPGEVEYEPSRKAPSDREIEMAGRLVESLHEDFVPSRYRDEHRDAVLALVERKAAGETIEPAPAPAPQQDDDDLIAALEASLGGGR